MANKIPGDRILELQQKCKRSQFDFTNLDQWLWHYIDAIAEIFTDLPRNALQNLAVLKI